MLPKVDFYILNTASYEERLTFTCKLIESIYQQNHKLFVFCQEKSRAELLDENLWTFKDTSFIPHHLQNEGPTPPAPIQIGLEAPSKYYRDILLNETCTIPPFYSQFNRIIEIIHDDEEVKIKGRERYRNYQSNGLTIRNYKISCTAEISS